jgi:hypothetical protein
MAIKIFHVILLASVKYIITLPYAMLIGLNYEQAIFAVLTGGIGGFLFFYYLSKPVIKGFGHIQEFICRIISRFYKKSFRSLCEREKKHKKVKVFSWKNRFLVRFKRTYGFWGVIVCTPLFLTIPLGAFLAGRYYSGRRHIVMYMIISITGWAAVLTGIMNIFPKLFFE